MAPKSLDCKILESSMVVATGEQISSALGDEAVILNLKTGTYHGLNQVGALVWNLIQQPKAVKDIQQTLLEEYEVKPEVCILDLLGLLNDLKVAGLIEVKDDTSE
ncbi:hypothetical protein NUACC21_82050 [Scytonema sp. NUACC21]